MAILRFAPGERCAIAGYYYLVCHYGEPTGISVPRWVDEGESFPLLGVDADSGPLWFVRRPETTEGVKAA